MASVKLLLFAGKTLKDKTHPIMLRVIHNRRSKYTTTGFSCKVNQWNAKSETFRANFQDSETANRECRKQKAELELTVTKNETNVSKSGDIDLLTGKIKHKHVRTPFILEYTSELIKRMKAAGQIGNASVYNTVKNSVEKFNDGDIRFTEIDAKWLSQFEESYYARNVRETTIYCAMKTLRAIFNKAINEGHCPQDQYPFRARKFSYNLETSRRALTKQEMKLLADFDVCKSQEIRKRMNLILAKNLFMFSFFGVGINFVDLSNLKWNNVKNGRLKFRRQKTGTLIDLQLTKEMLEILEVYKSKKAESFIFPILKEKHKSPVMRRNTIQHKARQVNLNIKDIAAEAGILNAEEITFYSARHSWANIQRSRGTSLHVISGLMEHADFSTTEIYLQSLTSEVKDAANQGLLD